MEIDDYCNRVLAKHWPNVQRYGDIRTVTNVERVDVLCGGFPCQDISNAGKQAGIDGARSGLWSEYVRLIRELRPRYVIVENVAALLGRGMGRVLGDLSESGYDAEWNVISAADIGARHKRERIWIVANPRYVRGGDWPVSAPQAQSEIAGSGPSLADAERKGLEGLCQPEGINIGCTESEWLCKSSASCGDVAHAASERQSRPWKSILQGGTAEGGDWEAGSALSECFRDFWRVEPAVGRVAHGIPARMDRLKGLGNAIVPQIAEWIGRRILDYEAAA